MSDNDPKTGRDARGRFLKGQSANPKGRPARAPRKPKSSLDVLFDRTVSVKAPDGTSRELSAQEAIDQSVVKEALKGKAGAIGRAAKMLIKRDKWFRAEAEKKAQRANKYSGSAFSEIESYGDPDNANDALQILGIATRDTDYEAAVDRPGYIHLRLEHWAVEMALARRRKSEPLSDQDILSINVCTHDPEKLTWPKGSRI